jgi:hypothetical protein
MKSYDFILISQFSTLDNYQHLLESLNKADLENISVLLLFINQSSKEIRIDQYLNHEVIIIDIKKMVSLSKSRNLAIEYLLENNFSSKYVMIPDDDCWFSETFFRNVLDMPFQNYGINVIDPYQNKSHLKFPIKEKRLMKKDFGIIMSINQIFLYDSFIGTGFFDENLGIGSIYGGSEDSDFFCRVCDYYNFVFTPKLEIYHLLHLSKFQNVQFWRLLKMINGYAKGLFYMAKKNNLHYTVFRTAFITPLKIPYYILKRNIKMSLIYFFNSFHNFFFFLVILPFLKIERKIAKG